MINGALEPMKRMDIPAMSISGMKDVQLAYINVRLFSREES